jgi:hypothetical protein
LETQGNCKKREFLRNERQRDSDKERPRDREEFFVVAWSCSLLQRVKNMAVMTIHGFEVMHSFLLSANWFLLGQSLCRKDLWHMHAM